MQTFLPYPNFEQCAKVLDNKRLNKQILEGTQILKLILGIDSNSWSNHPCTKMWSYFPGLLYSYIKTMNNEYSLRNKEGKDHGAFIKLNQIIEPLQIESTLPWWLGNNEFHKYHRRNLTRKDINYYLQFWDEEEHTGYLWPNPDYTFTLISGKTRSIIQSS